MSQFFSTNYNSTLTFVELTHVGFAWWSWLQWPAVFKLEGQVFKLEGVIYYVDPKSVGSMGFLGGKERIRIPINSKHSSLETLKRHFIEYIGLKSESEKNGLIRSSIEIKLCRLEKSAEWSKASGVNNDDNKDEMTFLRAVTILVAVKHNFVTSESQMTFLLSTIYPPTLVIISLSSPTFHCMFTWLPLLPCTSCAGGTKSKNSTLLLNGN